MTLNDFKSVKGDRQMGIQSLLVLLGPQRAARCACLIMAVPKAAVVALLLVWSRPVHAGIVTVLLAAQVVLMLRFLRAPAASAVWYSGFGVPLYVLGLIASAFAVQVFGTIAR